MIPDSIAALSAFLLLIAPGLLSDLLAGRRQTQTHRTAFRELSGTVLASLAYTLVAGVLVGAIIVLVTGASMAGIREAISDPNYLQNNRVVTLLALITVSGLACLLAWGVHLMKFRGVRTRLEAVSAWYRVLHQDCPKGSLPYVRLRLANGYTYMGTLSWYTADLQTKEREIVICPPMRITPPEGKSSSVPAEWRRMVFRSEDIMTLTVSYQPNQYGHMEV